MCLTARSAKRIRCRTRATGQNATIRGMGLSELWLARPTDQEVILAVRDRRLKTYLLGLPKPW
jgi:hypothetical protein